MVSGLSVYGGKVGISYVPWMNSLMASGVVWVRSAMSS